MDLRERNMCKTGQEVPEASLPLSPIEEERVKLTEALNSFRDREFDVFAGVCDGNSNKEIARLLGLSPKTVEIYRGRIRKKLGYKSFIKLLFAHGEIFRSDRRIIARIARYRARVVE